MPRSDDKQVTDAPVLSSRGRAYFATIFDVLGTVTYAVNSKGSIYGCLEIENLPRAVAERFHAAYGGKVTARGWRIEKSEAVRFAEEASYFVLDKADELKLFCRGMRLVGAKKAIKTGKGFRQLPLSERDKKRRRSVAMELDQVRALSARRSAAIPPKFLR